LFGLLITLLVGLTGCGPKSTSIRLPMGYVASVQFAPVYVAVERGYFAEEGIELEFDYSWETNGVQLVGAGELPFAIASGDQVLLAREQGLPVVTFVNWWRRFPVAVVALKEAGMEEPAALAGHRVGIPEMFGASYIGWRALAAASGLTDEDVQLEVVQFAVADYATLVSNGIITNEKTLQENPKLVRAFARAFLNGLEDTLADPDAAFDICRKYVEGLNENEAVQRAVLEASLEYWQGDPLGASNSAAWQATADVMLDAGLLSTAVDAEKAFTNDYLP